MAVEKQVRWFGVCDECGAVDDDSRLTEAEARDRMWNDEKGRELCWDCMESR